MICEIQFSENIANDMHSEKRPVYLLYYLNYVFSRK